MYRRARTGTACPDQRGRQFSAGPPQGKL